ncbi:hypothetical protein [Pseudomonas phage HU1]|nr:hypothetical protein [Pseudomonas phage HU1]
MKPKITFSWAGPVIIAALIKSPVVFTLVRIYTLNDQMRSPLGSINPFWLFHKSPQQISCASASRHQQ